MLSIRQTILKFFYPFIIKTKKGSIEKGMKLLNTQNVLPSESFFNLSCLTNRGQPFSLKKFEGKKIIVVNLASNCGFTNQYAELEALYRKYSNDLIILGFPANDFNNQEIGDDIQIERFCKINFGITFPLLKKQSVLKPNQNEVYQWLTEKSKNGWNEQVPVWNFSKYIINEKGTLVAFFGPAITPFDKPMLKALGLKK